MFVGLRTKSWGGILRLYTTMPSVPKSVLNDSLSHMIRVLTPLLWNKDYSQSPPCPNTFTPGLLSIHGAEHWAWSPLLMTCDPQDKLLTELQSCFRRLMPTWSVTFHERAIFLLNFFGQFFFLMLDFQIAAERRKQRRTKLELLHH